MLKPLGGCSPFKRLKVVSAAPISVAGQERREWICQTRSGKMFHLLSQEGALYATNVVEREYDLEFVDKPIARVEPTKLHLNVYGIKKNNRIKITFEDIINLMGWKIDSDQYFD